MKGRCHGRMELEPNKRGTRILPPPLRDTPRLLVRHGAEAPMNSLGESRRGPSLFTRLPLIPAAVQAPAGLFVGAYKGQMLFCSKCNRQPLTECFRPETPLVSPLVCPSPSCVMKINVLTAPVKPCHVFRHARRRIS